MPVNHITSGRFTALHKARNYKLPQYCPEEIAVHVLYLLI